MRTNVQFDHADFITYPEIYQEKDGGVIEHLSVTKLVNFAVIHQPDLPRQQTATVRLYQSRITIQKTGIAPRNALLKVRGVVSNDFSRKSRRRLMDAFHSWQVPDGYKRYHIVLTYPAIYSPDWKVWKDNLKAFKRKIQNVFGDNLQGYWRLELQKRGAPHYHLLIALQKGAVTNKKLKKLVTKWWAAIAHSNDQYEGKYATQVKVIHNDKMAQNYVSKYVAKITPPDRESKESEQLSLSEQFEAGVSQFKSEQERQKTIGRHWGRMGKTNESPIAEFTLSELEQAQLRHVLAMWAWEINPRYADTIRDKPDWLSYQVYGIKAYAMLMVWHDLFPPHKSPPGFNPFKEKS